MGFKDHKEYLFTKESDIPLDTKKPVFLTSYKDSLKQTYRADRVINFGKSVASATSRDLSYSPHKTAAIAVVDATNSLIAKGVAKSTIALAINYSLLGGTDDSSELGKNLSSILGVHRSTIELCIPQIKPQISYSKRNRSITILASANAPKRPIESRFKNGDTKIYFLPIYFLESGLPDYEKYRQSVSYFYSQIEEDRILSSFAINENLSQTLKSAAKATNLNFFESYFFECFGQDAYSNAHGILFESYEKDLCNDYTFLIGETIKKEIVE